MLTLSGLAGVRAVAETGSATWPVLAVASVTGDSEVVAAREQVAPVSAPTVSAYVLVYRRIDVSNHKVN